MTELSCKLTCCTMLKNIYLSRAQTLGASILINCLGNVMQSILPSFRLHNVIIKCIFGHSCRLLEVENCKLQTTSRLDIIRTCLPKHSVQVRW